jgi:hypothetical protein
MSETTTPAELEVPGEPGVYWCARHKNVKTRLRCGRCEKPICPKCTKIGPTGARCPNCYSNRDAHIFQVSPLQFALAFGASVLFGALSALFVSMVGLLLVFFSPVAGTFFGKAVTTITRGKRGSRLAVVASVGTVFGAIIVLTMHLLSTRAMLANPAFADPSIPVDPMMFAPGLLADAGFVVAYLAFAIPSMWWWIK